MKVIAPFYSQNDNLLEEKPCLLEYWIKVVYFVHQINQPNM